MATPEAICSEPMLVGICSSRPLSRWSRYKLMSGGPHSHLCELLAQSACCCLLKELELQSTHSIAHFRALLPCHLLLGTTAPRKGPRVRKGLIVP